MVNPGPTKTADTETVAANLLQLARIQSGLCQRALAASAGVPQSTIGRIETGTMQPTLPLLYKILAAAGLGPESASSPTTTTTTSSPPSRNR